MYLSAIIVASGSGNRMKSTIKKQFMRLREKEVLAYTVDVFEKMKEIQEIIVVVGIKDTKLVHNMLCEQYNCKKVSYVVAGGRERQHSVENGLTYVSKDCTHVLIHDGVRPFVRPDAIMRGIEGMLTYDACTLAVPVKDTIKRCNLVTNKIEETFDREALFQIQTPQFFEKNLIIEAHKHANKYERIGTDDTTLVEWLGKKVYIVQGDYNNIKITTPEDLQMGEAILDYYEKWGIDEEI